MSVAPFDWETAPELASKPVAKPEMPLRWWEVVAGFLVAMLVVVLSWVAVFALVFLAWAGVEWVRAAL